MTSTRGSFKGCKHVKWRLLLLLFYPGWKQHEDFDHAILPSYTLVGRQARMSHRHFDTFDPICSNPELVYVHSSILTINWRSATGVIEGHSLITSPVFDERSRGHDSIYRPRHMTNNLNNPYKSYHGKSSSCDTSVDSILNATARVGRSVQLLRRTSRCAELDAELIPPSTELWSAICAGVQVAGLTKRPA